MSNSKHHVEVATYQKEKKETSCCGDSYFFSQTKDGFICAIADGLGSGEHARESSQAVIDTIENNTELSDQQLIRACNEKLIGKRGVVLGILRLDYPAKEFKYSAIGNINLLIISPDKKIERNRPVRGFLSSYAKKMTTFTNKLESPMKFILYSDGIEEYELLKNKNILYKDVDKFIKEFQFELDDTRSMKDDTTIIAVEYINNNE